MIRIAICDDEKFMRDELGSLIGDFFRSENMETDLLYFADGNSLLKYEKPLDIIFLDVQMPAPDGMETAKLLRRNHYRGFLIFVTVMEELVFDSFEVQAFDFLIKPVEQKRLKRTMKRLFSAIKNSPHTNLVIQRGNEHRIIPFDDILYCEIVNRKIYLHLVQQETVSFYGKIEDLEKQLDNRFFKCHRSYLVNLKYIRSYKKGTASLSNGENIPVSRLRNEDFSNVILHYMETWRY